MSKSHFSKTQEDAGDTDDEAEASIAEFKPRYERKPPTECKNDAFLRSLDVRNQEYTDFLAANKRIVKSMNSGRLAAGRITLPEGIEIYGYSG